MSLQQLQRWTLDRTRLSSQMNMAPEGEYVLWDDVKAMFPDASEDGNPDGLCREARIKVDAYNCGRDHESVAQQAANNHTLNQLTTLRIIADKACLMAIDYMDMEHVSTDDIMLIDRYLAKTEYLGQEGGDGGSEGSELDFDFVRDVIHPLMAAELAPLMDYVGGAQREMERKKRIKDELQQLKVIRDSIHRVALMPPDLSAELEASRTALLFASSDVLDRATLMELSPSVRIARTLAKIKERTGVDICRGIDWSQADAEPTSEPASEHEETAIYQSDFPDMRDAEIVQGDRPTKQFIQRRVVGQGEGKDSESEVPHEAA